MSFRRPAPPIAWGSRTCAGSSRIWDTNLTSGITGTICSTNRTMTKVLLLGIGRWGANHLRVLHSLPIELFVAELDGKRLESARKLGIPDHRLSTQYKNFAGVV